MTPEQLLESVKQRFTPLLHDEPEKLNALLRTALTAYQDRAGCIRKMKLQRGDDLTFTPKSDFLELISVVDATGDWVYSDVIDGNIEIEASCRMRYPLTIEYLMRLDALDLEVDELPHEAVGILQNYLEVLIAIPNTHRRRQVAIAQKLDASDLADEQTLYQRKVDLELEIANRGAIPGAITIYSSMDKM